MMILISGQPGNGKTLRALALAEAEYNRNMEAVKAGREEPRQFFANIAGATYPDNPDAFPWMQPMPDHNDWRELPDGSFVIYDEAHSDGNTQGLERYGLLFPSTGKPGESDDPRIRAMSTHRHRGFDLVFVTQWPNKIHHNVRTLVGKHIHMNRAMGLAAAGVLAWTRVQSDPYDEKQRDKAEEEIWHFPKGVYKRYRSATLHTATYKFKVPKKLIGALSTAAMIVLVMGLLWVFVFDPNKDREEEAAQEAPIAQAPAGAGGAPAPLPGGVVQVSTEPPVAPAELPELPTPAGCMVGVRGCSCWGRDGRKIPQDEAMCLDMLASFPLDMSASQGRQQPPQPSSAPATAAGVGAAHGQPRTALVGASEGSGAFGKFRPGDPSLSENPGWGTTGY